MATAPRLDLRLHRCPEPLAATAGAPNALVCGWYGATHRQMRHYVSLYHSLHYNVATLIVPRRVVFPVHASVVIQFTLSVLRGLRERLALANGDGEGLSSTLVLHCLSTAGALPAYALACLLGDSDAVDPDDDGRDLISEMRGVLAAVVFDSGPSYMHDHLAASALAEGLSIRSAYGRLAISAAHKAFSTVRRAFIDHVPRQIWHTLLDARYGCPEFYIYSADDALLDVPLLESLIRTRSRTQSVQVCRVQLVPHVRILRHRPRDYSQLIHNIHHHAVNPRRRKLQLAAWDPSHTSANIPAKL